MTKKKKEETAVAKKELSMSERFILKVTGEMAAAIGAGVKFSESQKRLATNLFVKVDNDLQNAEADRVKKNRGSVPIVWANVNMQKLALDAAHRIQLGLDALVPNHLHTIPYLNGKTNKYDLDIRIGYKGKHLYRIKFCSDDVVDIRYELVHENDHFKLLKKNEHRPVETYEFEIDEPFNRGEVIGGFGYIVYKDETMNKVVIVSREDMDKIKKSYTSGPVWKSEWEHRMQLKTVVHRTTESLNIDTTKTNMSYHYVEAQDDPFRDDLDPSKAIEAGDRETLSFDDESDDTDAGDAIHEHEAEEVEGSDPSDFEYDGNGKLPFK
jgi:recombination protein RecT